MNITENIHLRSFFYEIPEYYLTTECSLLTFCSFKTFARVGMEKLKTNSFLKIVSIWFLINTVLGIVITLMISLNSSFSFWEIFILSEINTHIISSFSTASGYFFGNKFKDRMLIPATFLTLAGVYPATLVALTICIFINNELTNIHFNYNHNILALSLLLTTVITFITTIIERLMISNSVLEINLSNILKNDLFRDRNDGKISFKEKDNYFTIEAEKIIYLSSHGKRTVVHTEERDYEVASLIKEVELKLDSDKFIRVHKQFILNVNYISRIQYYSGGAHIAYLKDNDENTIPVGRTYISALKEKMRL